MSWDKSGPDFDDIWDWYDRNELRHFHPKVLVPKATRQWLQKGLPQMGFTLGRKLGEGNLGVVFNLLHRGRSTGWVAKVTNDPAEAATVHRLMDARIVHPAFPKLRGAWEIPGKRWLIIREDIPLGCRTGWADFPPPKWVSQYADAKICQSLGDVGLFVYGPDEWMDEDDIQEVREHHQSLSPQERKMVERLHAGLRKAAKAGIYFGDLHTDNIRFRPRPKGGKDLVVVDFGLSVGPRVSVPRMKSRGG